MDSAAPDSAPPPPPTTTHVVDYCNHDRHAHNTDSNIFQMCVRELCLKVTPALEYTGETVVATSSSSSLSSSPTTPAGDCDTVVIFQDDTAVITATKSWTTVLSDLKLHAVRDSANPNRYLVLINVCTMQSIDVTTYAAVLYADNTVSTLGVLMRMDSRNGSVSSKNTYFRNGTIVVLWSYRNMYNLRIQAAVLSHKDKIMACCDIHTEYKASMCDGITIHVEDTEISHNHSQLLPRLPPLFINLDSFHCQDNPTPASERFYRDLDKLVAYTSAYEPHRVCDAWSGKGK